MVYDLIYDNEGNVIDAMLMQCGHGLGKYYVKTKIPTAITIGDSISFGSGNHYLYHNSKFNTNYEDGLEEGCLNLTQITKEKTWNNISNNSKEYSILRFIQQDSEGNPILKYEGLEYDDSNHDSELINLSNKAKDRLKYSRLYTEKIVNVHTDDVVNTNDELTYTIVVKNNSSNNYSEEITVIENLSDYVTYKDYEVNKDNISFNEDLENKKLSWNIGKLNSGEEVRIEYTVIVKENCYGQTIESTGTVENIPSAIVKNKISNNLKKSQENSIKEKYNELKNEYTGKELINEIYKEALGIDLKFNEFEITDLINNTKTTSTSATTISLNENNSFYDSVLNKYWSTLYSKTYNYTEEGDIIAYDLKLWKRYEQTTRRSDTIYSENFKTGDILVYKNENDVTYNYENDVLTTKPVTYEKGEYVYIYIEGKGFVGVNYGSDGIIGTQDDRNEFNSKYYTDNGLMVYSNESETDANILEFANYQSLFGKDYYVILRPSMSVDIVPMELEINYSTTNKTNEDVLVTIISNEEMCNVESWNLSEDKKTLTKKYTENKNDELKIYDYSGNEKIVEIKVENIDKEKPILSINYSTINATNKEVIVTITANEEIRGIDGWNISEDGKNLTKTYTSNYTENITVFDIAGNSELVTINISNIDKNKPNYEVSYSTTKLTNQDVTVSVMFDKVIQELQDWNLSENKKTLTKTFSENIETSIKVQDYLGNESDDIIIKIENIDKVKPEVSVQYSTIELTNQEVIVTIIANEKIREVEGWRLSDNENRLTKTYTANNSENITILDLAGNSTSALINITNIDKHKPTCEVLYSTTKPTNQDVTVSIKFDKIVQELQGWNLSENKKTLTKAFSENISTTIKVKDSLGNESDDIIIKIENIDKVKPNVNIQYSTRELTNQDVIVTIFANEKIQEVEGWQLSDDGKTLSKRYLKNAEEIVTIYDLAGNEISEKIKVENIDKEKPQYNIKYSIISNTNQDVIVTIIAMEKIQYIEGWNLSKDKKSLTKVYTENTKETITISDIAGNTVTDTININNIDKIAPKIEIIYSEKSVTYNDVVVTIIADEVIKDVDSWTLSNNMKELTKIFKQNAEEDVIITDNAGNSITVRINVSNINKNITDKNEKFGNDKTTSGIKFPNAGNSNVFIFISIFVIIFVIVCEIIHTQLKKYKDVN